MYSKNELYEIENILKKDIEEVCDYIFKNPELGNEEYKASEYLVNKLKENGFKC